MAKKTSFVFCLVLLSIGVAQSQTVTNMDLEKYRQERLSAERDYRENYAKLGFPSPEELQKQEEQSRKETEELSAKLRTSRLERERLDAYREAEMNRAIAYNRQVQSSGYYDPGYYDPFYGGYSGYGGIGGLGKFGGRFGRHRIRHHGFGYGGLQTGYYAGGQFWPTPVKLQRPGPMIVQKGRGGYGGGGFGGGHGGGGGGGRRGR